MIGGEEFCLDLFRFRFQVSNLHVNFGTSLCQQWPKLVLSKMQPVGSQESWKFLLSLRTHDVWSSASASPSPRLSRARVARAPVQVSGRDWQGAGPPQSPNQHRSVCPSGPAVTGDSDKSKAAAYKRNSCPPHCGRTLSLEPANLCACSPAELPPSGSPTFPERESVNSHRPCPFLRLILSLLFSGS